MRDFIIAVLGISVAALGTAQYLHVDKESRQDPAPQIEEMRAALRDYDDRLARQEADAKVFMDNTNKTLCAQSRINDRLLNTHYAPC